MYTNDKNEISFKTIILQILIVALFIFLVVWLFPMKNDYKKLQSSVDELSSSKIGGTKLSSDSKGEVSLSVLYDRIFNENVISMKDSAKSYFTTERLPQKVNESVKMTLKEMLDAKIILPFVDKNGDKCDETASYVQITKYENEFVMKVNLKCGDEENYLLIYMGCYDYCQTAICEKNKVDIKTPTLYSAKPTKKQPVTPTKKYGSPSCTLTASGTRNNDGTYSSNITIKFSSKKAGLNTKLTGYGLGFKTTYNGKNSYTVTKYGKTTVFGFVKNSAGKTASCNITVNRKKATTKEYLYEYAKVDTTDGYWNYGDWSAWSTTAYTPSDNLQVKRRLVTQKVITGYNVTTVQDTTKPIYSTKSLPVGSTTIKSCSQYKISGGTATYTSSWTYKGLVKLTSAPTNTNTVKYVYAGKYDYYCKSTSSCTAGSVYVYKKYEKTVSKVSNGGTYTCSKWATDTKVYIANVQVVTGYETKTIKEPVYGTTTYYQYAKRTRYYVPGTSNKQTKWSHYNDRSLLDNNWAYTGNKKEK